MNEQGDLLGPGLDAPASLFNVEMRKVARQSVQTVDARDLHAFLEVARDFPTWIKDRLADFVEKQDYVVHAGLSSPNPGSSKSRPQKTKEYTLTTNTAKHLCQLERNEKGRQARQYLIDCEERLMRELRHRAALGSPDAAMKKEMYRAEGSGLKKTAVKLAEAEVRIIDRVAEMLKEHQKTETEQHRQMLESILKYVKAKEDWPVANPAYRDLSGVYREGGFDVIPARGRLSQSVIRSLDAYCKRKGLLMKAFPVNGRLVNYWPIDGVWGWLRETGREMIQAHIARHPKIEGNNVVAIDIQRRPT